MVVLLDRVAYGIAISALHKNVHFLLNGIKKLVNDSS